MRKTSETTENIGNAGIGLGANITTERGGKCWKTMENIGNVGIGTGTNITMERGGKHQKTTENIGKVGIGTGGNMVHDRLRITHYLCLDLPVPIGHGPRIDAIDNSLDLHFSPIGFCLRVFLIIARLVFKHMSLDCQLHIYLIKNVATNPA